MKVAIIYDLSEPGGVQTCVISLIKGLNRKAITPTVYWDSGPNEKLITCNHVKINFERLPCKISSSLIKRLPNAFRYLLWPFNISKISQIATECEFLFLFSPLIIIDKSRPHIFYLSGPPLLPQLEPKSTAFKLIKSIYKIFIKPLYPAYEPQADANYVINSQYTADLFEKAHGRRLDVVYPANQLSAGTDENQNISERDTVTFFSRIVNYKRPELLISIAEKYPEYRFVIMGGLSDGRLRYYNNLKQDAINKNLTNIEFYPNATRSMVKEIFARTKIYFFPAINEHFGITTVESILEGCIPFVHNSGGQKEIVPLEHLRFDDNEMFEKFDVLINKPPATLKKWNEELVAHCQQFTEESFVNAMMKIAGIV